MREIKFRAWDKKKKEFIAGYKLLGGFNLFGEYMLLEGLNMENWNNLEVNQYTGLKDKNGKEIYNGDIMKTKEYPLKRFEVYWRKECASFNMIDRKTGHIELFKFSNILLKTLEVIGNIYENPELLKK